jgi:hypothetical protein
MNGGYDYEFTFLSFSSCPHEISLFISLLIAAFIFVLHLCSIFISEALKYIKDTCEKRMVRGLFGYEEENGRKMENSI